MSMRMRRLHDNEQEQIEEMAEVYESARLKARETLGSMNEGEGMWYSKAFYAEGYRKQEWISVEERLPDPNEYDWVLVNVEFNEDGSYGVPRIAEYRKGEWWDSYDRLSDLFITVTHWTPLPEPPKGGEG